jgi:alanine racemase
MANTRAVVDLEQFRSNLAEIRRLIDMNPMICLAVKADAYGHGAIRIAREAVENGVTWLAVATPVEALELRAAGIGVPILLLCPTTSDYVVELIENDVSCLVTDTAYVSMFHAASQQLGKRARLHLEIDTGMGRTGCSPENAPGIAATILCKKNLLLEGICTHFAGAENDDTYTKLQISRFDSALSGIEVANVKPIIHASNSAGMMNYPTATYDMIRPGIAAYGYSSAGEPGFCVEPIMDFVSKVVFLKDVPAETAISYGMTYKTMKNTIVGTVAAGYADGYPRLLSNKGEVLIGDVRYRVSGTVCMDQFMIDLGPGSNVRLYDDVILFGRANSAPDAADIGAWTGTIPYEILCNVGKRVPREYIG